jgi:hypothetical protein
LAYLVSLGKVGVKIILAIKLRIFRELAAQGRPHKQNMLESFFVYRRKSAGMSHANRANIDIGMFFKKIIGRFAEHLGSGLKFDMNLQTNPGLKLHII